MPTVKPTKRKPATRARKPATRARKPATRARKPATRKQLKSMSDREILNKSLGKVVQKPSVDVAVKVFNDLDKKTQYNLLAKHKIPSSEVSTTQKLKNTLRRNGRFLIAVTLVATSSVLLLLAHQHKIIDDETIQQVVKEFNSLGGKWWKHVKKCSRSYYTIIKNFFYGPEPTSPNPMYEHYAKLPTSTVNDAPLSKPTSPNPIYEHYAKLPTSTVNDAPLSKPTSPNPMYEHYAKLLTSTVNDAP